ncbi:hypothetical protein ACFE04_008337 [Oxalis oulophora]
MWNQHDAAVANSHKTNNMSEGWHNRFRVVVAKHHPDLYSAIKELQKEQAITEVSLAELSLGRRVQNTPRPRWRQLQARIRNIVLEYDECPNRAPEALKKYILWPLKNRLKNFSTLLGSDKVKISSQRSHFRINRVTFIF